MKKITFWFLIVFTMVAFVPIVNSQTIIHQEDFEGADFSGYAIGNADTGTDYPSQSFQTSGVDYILRDVPTNFSFSQALTGNSTNMIGGEDINTFYNGHSYIELDPISISGKSNLTIDIDVAFPNTLDIRYEDNDFLIVDYRIDGTGSYTSVLAFNGNYGTFGCTRDDNLNGVTDAGEVTHVNQAMTTFNLDLNSITGSTVTGSTIEIRVRFSMPDSHEEFAFDNIVLKGSSSCTDPDVPTVTASPTSVCSGAQSTLTITGSLNDATQWAVYEGSCGGTLVATTNGSSVIVNPTSATTYYVRGEGGCVTPGSCGSVTVGVTAQDNAGFSYSALSYCANAADPSPTITGVTGGTFSSTAGLSINSTTGQIDVSASTPGTYTVTYTTAGTCPNSSTASVTINALDDASFSYSASAYCVSAADPTPTITGLTGGSFSSTAGLSISSSTGALDVSASTPGTYTVTYTTAGTCPNSSTASVTINALDDASFSYSASAYCVSAADPTPTITGLTGGSFSSTAGLSISSSTGALDVSASTPGTYTVTYTTAGACPNSSTASVTINALDDASFSYSASAYCVSAADPTPTINGLTGGTFSSSAGLSINSSTGQIDVSASTPGTYTVTYTTAGTCPNSSTASVTINALDDASFSYSASAYCVSAADPTPTINGLTGGTFSSTAGLSINSSTGQIDVSASTPGTYTITYTTAGSCPNSSTASVTINAIDNASFSYALSSVCITATDVTPTITGVIGGTFSSTAGLSINASTGQIDVSASTPGAYTITYTTVGSCSNSSNVNLTILSDNGFSASALTDANVTCNGGSDGQITASATGGTAPYAYAWSNTATTAIINGISAGSYSVEVTDNVGCKASANATITEPTALNAAVSSSTDVACTGGTTGAATVSVTGGTAPYTYAWSNSAVNPTITGLGAGTYTVLVTDANGCTANTSVTINEPTLLTSVALVDSNVSCNGLFDGGVTATPTGGTSPYTYLWNNTATTASLNGVAAGTYTVTITDANGCTTTASATVTEPTLLSATGSVNANVSCNAGSNGEATVNVTGGTAPYTYAWSNTATTQTITGVAAGTYTVTVTDANGCTENASVTITEPTVLSATGSVNANVSCNAGNDGEATVNVTGGTAPYTYAWSNTATTQTITGVTAGTYTVTITDANGCTTTASATVTEPTVLSASGVVNANVSCNAGGNGEATVNVTGGTAPYTYAWSNTATTQAITGVAAGTYTVTVTDANGCTTTASATVTEPTLLSATGSVNANVTCNAGSNGEATVNVTGGTVPYTYAWSNSATTQTITGVTAGTYTVTVTDANGCTTTASATITEPTVLSASGSVNANVSCNAGNDGEATVNVTGGTAPYTYAWSNTATTQTITGVTAGTYTVTITDANGCTTTASATVTEPTVLSASGVVNANVSCNAGGNGEATVNVTGGTAPYTYAWSNTATTQAITGVAAGTYTVTVTDANGCTTTASATVTEPTLLSATGSVNANVTCNAGSNGEATVNVTGGTVPYTYAWSNSATTQTITGVTAGTYTVTVTDANGCTTTASATITEPTVLSASGSVNANVSCNAGNDGEATVNVTGGTSPYTYAWSNTATTQTITGVAAGTYTVTVTDANGCTTTASATVTEPTLLSASGSVNANVSCNAGGDGEATVNVTGGTAPYTYAWSNSATTQTITGVTAGTYTVTVTDANGCTENASVTITEPTVLSTTGSVNANVSCNAGSDGEATVNVTGGTAPYTYAWSNSATTQTITGVTAGTYTVTVTDANGCTENASVTITEPNVLSATGSVNANVSCNAGNDGEATVNVTGGTAPYTYAWSNTATTQTISGVAAGTYTVTVTDANGCTENASVTITEPTVLSATGSVNANVSCNAGSDGEATINVTGGTAPYTYAWSNSATTQTITGVTAGTYTVTVTDANGCTATASATVTEPTVLSATGSVNANVSCNAGSDGEATVNVTGGTAPYTYAWSNTATTQAITGVTAGTYTVTVTDANGCTENASVTITEPTVLSATASVNAHVTCNAGSNGEATVSVTGGTAPYTYNWSNAAMTPTITGVTAGTYTVTVTDANGCTENASVTITEPTALLASTVVDATVSCNGLSDGAATVNASGGTAPYTYLWDNSETTTSISGLTAGTYNVVVTDANGCTVNASVMISEPAVLATTNTIQNVSCYGAMNGMVDVVPTGGTGPYAYSWSNQATTPTITGLEVGNYNVQITDANGCIITQNATITQPAILGASATAVADVTCPSSIDGSATVNPTGGTQPYTYLWDNGETSQTATALSSGVHTVSVIDANGCNQSTYVTIGTGNALDNASFAYGNSIYCKDAVNPVPTISGVNGGTFSATTGLQIDAATGEIDVLNSISGVYTVTYTTNGTCSNSSNVQVTIQDLDNASFNFDQTEYCQDYQNPTPTITGALGGTFTASSPNLVINAATGEIDIANSVAGNYSVTYTTNGYCSNSSAEFVTINTVNVATSVDQITITADAIGATYQWLDCDNNMQVIVGETSSSYTATANGNYAVIVTENGCSDTSDCVVISTVGLEKMDLANAFTVYPNPTQGTFNVQFDRVQEHIDFRIFNLAGELIQVAEMNFSNQMTMNIDLPKGVYLLEVTDKHDQKAVVKIIKQ